MAKKDPGNQRTVKIFVRIGALRRFDALKKKTAELPVKIEWDRRRGDRRQSPANVDANQRMNDRRQQLPFTWEAADFVVVEEDEDE
jgi:hypothetical protein